MNPNLKLSDELAVVGVIDPDLNTAGTVTTGWIDMADWFRLIAIVMAGALGTNATIDGKFEQATDSGGSGAKDVSGTAITQLTQAGTDKSDKQVAVNLRQSDLDFENGFTHARFSMTVATASSDSAVVVLGADARYGAAVDSDAASVDEIVN